MNFDVIVKMTDKERKEYTKKKFAKTRNWIKQANDLYRKGRVNVLNP